MPTKEPKISSLGTKNLKPRNQICQKFLAKQPKLNSQKFLALKTTVHPRLVHLHPRPHVQHNPLLSAIAQIRFHFHPSAFYRLHAPFFFSLPFFNPDTGTSWLPFLMCSTCTVYMPSLNSFSGTQKKRHGTFSLQTQIHRNFFFLIAIPSFFLVLQGQQWQ